MNIWPVPRDWEGETVVIIAGGPSVSWEQIEYIHGKDVKIIAINNAALLAPWADILYACDAKWWKWHEGMPEFRGIKVGLRYTMAGNGCENGWTEDLYPDIRSLAYDGFEGVSCIPGVVKSGKDSGYQAIQLAIQMGAAKIILIGYDMKSESIDLSRDQIIEILDGVLGVDYPILKREAIAEVLRDISMPHWHGHHPDQIPPPFDLMLKQYPKMLVYLDILGIEIINCTPDTALKVFEELPLEEAI